MGGPVRITQPLLDVLEVLLEAFREDADVHGWAIMKKTGRSGPTVYGVLDRLESAGWVRSEWEALAADANRPRRRLYRITAGGSRAASALLAERRPATRNGESPVLRPGFLDRCLRPRRAPRWDVR